MQFVNYILLLVALAARSKSLPGFDIFFNPVRDFIQNPITFGGFSNIISLGAGLFNYPQEDNAVPRSEVEAKDDMINNSTETSGKIVQDRDGVFNLSDRSVSDYFRNLPEGPCPEVPFAKDFDVNSYLGRWYEIERFDNPFQRGECVTTDLELLPNGTVSVTYSETEETASGTQFGLARPLPGTTEGKFNIQFPNTRDSLAGADFTEYNIITTDYRNYAVTYSCKIIDGKRNEYSAIISRKPKTPSRFLDSLKDFLKKANVDITRYIPVKNDETCLRVAQ